MKIKKVTIKLLEKHEASKEGIDWFKRQTEIEPIKLLNQLIKENKFLWANWAIIRIMTYNQYVSYAIYAAEQVINIYEKKYPTDNAVDAAADAAANATNILQLKILKYGLDLLKNDY